ncbi:tripartite tricarboxylate transporter TctB family protein [Phaeobacter sp. S60]|uniref:tripartite tricarboxylate transporter TctB family protein n=1 Tax=Phaeobacter sp. S60 TaxID=1569353 RepID=UPI00058C1516|nr:tripartite tricarboxylate transporter TctB family protein [Phaeobacter sp. S60]KII11676.1 hypothetical protein OO25_20445 [Phaeobacter sp. S60]
MTNRASDFVLAITLMVLAGVWTWLVVETIPPGFGSGEIGARAFPLAFGIILLALAALLLLHLTVSSDDPGAGHGGQAATKRRKSRRVKWLPAITLLIEIGLYGILLEKAGFVLATPVIILIVMLVNLRVRSITKLLAMSLGMTAGCWLLFEKVLGIYLANGTWINLG